MIVSCRVSFQVCRTEEFWTAMLTRLVMFFPISSRLVIKVELESKKDLKWSIVASTISCIEASAWNITVDI